MRIHIKAPGCIGKLIRRRLQEIRAAGFHCFDENHVRWLANAAEKWAMGELEDLKVGEDPNELYQYLAYEEGFASDLELLAEKVESPIEMLLGSWLLLHHADGYNWLTFEPNWASRPDPDVGTVFGCQIPIGNYRADFLFKTCLKGDYEVLVVECDGHDYHERTKEQARRDRSRDRSMLFGNVKVVRFTGSEIFRNPLDCASEAEVILARNFEELMYRHGIQRRRMPKSKWIREAVEFNPRLTNKHSILPLFYI